MEFEAKYCVVCDFTFIFITPELNKDCAVDFSAAQIMTVCMTGQVVVNVKMSCQRSVKLPFLFLLVLSTAPSFLDPVYLVSFLALYHHPHTLLFLSLLSSSLSTLFFLSSSPHPFSLSYYFFNSLMHIFPSSYPHIFLLFCYLSVSTHFPTSLLSPSLLLFIYFLFFFFSDRSHLCFSFSSLNTLPSTLPYISTYTLFLPASICGFLLFTKLLY